MSTTKIKLSKQVFGDADFDINSKKITNLATPTADADAATKAYCDSLLGANDAMLFKGTIGTGGTHTIAAFNALTTYNAGWTYRVIEAGTIRGKVCEVGDLVIILVDRTGSGNVDTDFTVAQTNVDGGVVGPASATDNAVARFDATTGKILQNSLVTIDDTGSVNIPTGQTYKINGLALTQDNIPDGTTNKAYTATEQSKLSGIASGATANAKAIGSEVTGGTDDTKFLTAKSLTDALISPVKLQSGDIHFAADAGATDAYAITLSPVPPALVAGMVVNFKANTINTGACTLNVNALGAKAIKKSYNLDLEDGDIKANQIVSVVYDGTNFQLVALIYIHPTTAGSVHVPSAGATAQILQYSSAGTAKWVTVSADITIADAGAMTIAAKAITLAKMNDLAQNTIIGRVTASTGVPEALSATNVRTIINVSDGLRIVREAPSGTKNGSNTDFTLANTPISGSEMVFMNGLLMNAGAGNDYTIATNTITFLTGAIPISTDVILVSYWK